MYIQRVMFGDRQVSAHIFVFVVWFTFPLFSFSNPLRSLFFWCGCTRSC